MERENLKKYVDSSNEMLLESGKTKKEVLEARKNNFIEKPLYLQFMRKTDEKRSWEMELVKYKNVDERSRRNANGCTGSRTENK